ncbi:hypothetical protein BCR32DRAFT_250270 [Anaeromyces robustus]|uniref:Ricin B lectin domain-containing protein n=1 Tax=Anaeromyces robustus TaxID=1754192 RepID=A0A1Y1W7H5_9FUNG|nr:hypothetical protein BCR32DRAFT_250270 [Anaeromyces robustus]|eukprot:ORX69335.1 hypothetical protein BCR32DRAFT_250270 [Anaeromyces robustus]
MKYYISLLLFLLICFINKSYESSTDKVAFLDIQTKENGIGDCIVIHSTNSSGKKIYGMIDTGKNADHSYLIVEEYLKKNNITKLEWILISHFHGDHYGGLERLMNNSDLTIKSIYMKEYHAADTYNKNQRITIDEYRKINLDGWHKTINSINDHNIPIKYISNRVNQLSLGNYQFKLLNVNDELEKYRDACKDIKGCNENANSIIAVGKNNNRYYYLNGDIDTYPSTFKNSSNSTLVNAYNQNRVDKWVKKGLKLYNIDHFDVYKVSHHGTSYNNIQESFVAAKPDICITCGKADYIGNKASTLINRIKKGNKNAKIYFSGDGTITVNQDQNGNLNIVQGPDEHVVYEEVTEEQWVYNVATNKCLYCPESFTYRPLLKTCDDSDDSKWIIKTSRAGYQFRSKVHPDWCLHVKDINKGTIIMGDCDDQSYIQFGDAEIHTTNTIKSSDKCLDIYNSKEINKESFRLQLNNCNNSSNLQNKWSLWNENPSGVKTVWIQNKNSKKCLYAPNGFDYRPIVSNCDSTDKSKWLISSSSKGYIRSLAYPEWCINLKDANNGTITVLKCDTNKTTFKYPTKSQDTLMSSSLSDRCLGLLEGDTKNRKLNLNKCDKSNDQHWEIKVKKVERKNRCSTDKIAFLDIHNKKNAIGDCIIIHSTNLDGKKVYGNYQFKLLNVNEVLEPYKDECKEWTGCNENSNSIIAVGKNNNNYYYLNGDIDTYPSTKL